MRNNDPFADLIRSLEENLEREGGWVPPETPRRPVVTGGGNPRRWLWIIIPILLFILLSRGLGFYANWFWYDSLGLTSVFLTRLWASFGLFAAGALIFWLFLAFNMLLAQRLEPRGLADTALDQFADAIGVRVRTLLLGGAALLAIFVVLQQIWFHFTLPQLAVVLLGTLAMRLCLLNLRKKTFPELTRRLPRPLVALIQFMGRRTLEIYVAHLLIFKVIGIALGIGPHRTWFTLKWI